ncbi:hypothetical protein MC885_021329 [Smutsia gigantea]|nr:hypothetical protein MC885_021329 [Smutsia gigantea]
MGGATEAPDLLLLGPQLVVAGFSTHVEILRAHEIANEVRRVKKQLKDCQQLAALYNNRERIFGLPTTSVGLLQHTQPLGMRKGPASMGTSKPWVAGLWHLRGRTEQAAERRKPTPGPQGQEPGWNRQES